MSKRHFSVQIAIRIDAELDRRLTELMEKTHLSRADLVRLAVERGLPAVEASLLTANDNVDVTITDRTKP